MSKKDMITEILFQCRINNVKNLDDVFFGLAFLSEAELKKMCVELHIKTK